MLYIAMLVTPAERRDNSGINGKGGIYPMDQGMAYQCLTPAGSKCFAAKMKNPGARACATGANRKAVSFTREDTACEAAGASPTFSAAEFLHNLDRTAAANHLINAVFACDRADRLWLLEMIHDELRAGHRAGHPYYSLDGDAMYFARSWARTATRAEHKAYCLAAFEALSPQDQAAFLAYVSGRAAA